MLEDLNFLDSRWKLAKSQGEGEATRLYKFVTSLNHGVEVRSRKSEVRILTPAPIMATLLGPAPFINMEVSTAFRERAQDTGEELQNSTEYLDAI